MSKLYKTSVQDRPTLQTRYAGYGKSLTASLVSGLLGCAAVCLALAMLVIAHEIVSETNTEVPEHLTVKLKKPVPKKPETPVSGAPERVVTVPASPFQLKEEPREADPEKPEFLEVPEPVESDLIVLEELDEHPFEEEKEEVEAEPDTRVAETETKPVRRQGPSQAEIEERERRRRAALAQKITRTAQLVGGRVTPHYPRSARRKRLEGRVVITVTVGPDGEVSSCKVSQSSGHAVLDQSALSAARRHRFIPAKNGLGQAVSVKKLMPFNFRLAG